MNKKEQKEVDKIINRYFRGMQRYANEISHLIFKFREQDFVREIKSLQKQLVKGSASYKVLEELKSKYTDKPKDA